MLGYKIGNMDLRQPATASNNSILRIEYWHIELSFEASLIIKIAISSNWCNNIQLASNNEHQQNFAYRAFAVSAILQRIEFVWLSDSKKLWAGSKITKRVLQTPATTSPNSFPLRWRRGHCIAVVDWRPTVFCSLGSRVQFLRLSRTTSKNKSSWRWSMHQLDLTTWPTTRESISRPRR